MARWTCEISELRSQPSCCIASSIARSHFCLCKHSGQLSEAASCYLISGFVFFCLFLLLLLLYRVPHYFLISFCGGCFASGEAFCSVYALFTPSSLKTYFGVEGSQALRRPHSAERVLKNHWRAFFTWFPRKLSPTWKPNKQAVCSPNPPAEPSVSVLSATRCFGEGAGRLTWWIQSVYGLLRFHLSILTHFCVEMTRGFAAVGLFLKFLWSQ